MIEILSKDNYPPITNQSFQNYLHYSLNRLPKEYLYPEFGYFVIVEDFSELETTNTFNNIQMPSLRDDIFFERYLELVELKDDVIEIVVLLDADWGISIIMEKAIIPLDILEKLLPFVH